MTFKKDLIIVHFQEEFFIQILSDDNLKKNILSEFTPIVNTAVSDPNTHISILESADTFNPKGILSEFTTIKKLKPGKIDWFFAPSGDVLSPNKEQFKLQSHRVVITGGWIGACLNFAIASIIAAFLRDFALFKSRKLELFLSERSTYKSNGKTMSAHADSVIIDLIDSVFNINLNVYLKNGSFQFPAPVKNAGLTYTILDDAHHIISRPKTVLKPQEGDKPFEIIFFTNA